MIRWARIKFLGKLVRRKFKGPIIGGAQSFCGNFLRKLETRARGKIKIKMLLIMLNLFSYNS